RQRGANDALELLELPIVHGAGELKSRPRSGRFHGPEPGTSFLELPCRSLATPGGSAGQAPGSIRTSVVSRAGDARMVDAMVPHRAIRVVEVVERMHAGHTARAQAIPLLAAGRVGTAGLFAREAVGATLVARALPPLDAGARFCVARFAAPTRI